MPESNFQYLKKSRSVANCCATLFAGALLQLGGNAQADFVEKTYDTPQPSAVVSLKMTGSRESKLQAIKTFRQHKEKSEGWLPDLTPLLKDPDLETEAQAAACILSVDIERHDATKTLTSLLKNKDANLRIMAINSAGQAGEGALPLLKEFTGLLQGDISPKVREKAVWAIGRIGPKAKDAIPNLIEALKKNHPYENFKDPALKTLDDVIYRTCIDSLGSIGGGSAQACSALTALAGSTGKSGLQNEALKTLARMGAGAAPAVPALFEMIEDATESKKVQLLNTLRDIGPAANAALPKLNECLTSKSAAVRKAALRAILAVETNEKTKQAVLTNAVNDEDQQIKSIASEALEQSTAVSPEAMKGLIETADHGKSDARLASIMELGNYGKLALEALPMLVKNNLGSSFSPPQRKAAFEAIKKIDPAASHVIPMVKDNLKDPFKARAAIELLEYIGTPQCKKIAEAYRTQWHM